MAQRTVGPVTTATSGAAAVVLILVWLLSFFGIDVPQEVQGAFTVLVVLAAGYAVKPGTGTRRDA